MQTGTLELARSQDLRDAQEVELRWGGVLIRPQSGDRNYTMI